MIQQAQAEEEPPMTRAIAAAGVDIYSKIPDTFRGEAKYKVIRLKEMAAAWVGTPLESRTVPLLAMLMTENGALSENVRGDHGLAIGIEQNHLCKRGFEAPDFSKQFFCGNSAIEKFQTAVTGTEWDDYLTSWKTQFKHYTDTILGQTNDGQSVNDIITSWNPGEARRLAKVKSHEAFVRAAILL